MVEGTEAEFSVFDKVQLESTNVFRSCKLNGLRVDELFEFAHVVGVCVDGVGREIAYLHVLGEADNDFRLVLAIGRHGSAFTGAVLRKRSSMFASRESASPYNRFNR